MRNRFAAVSQFLVAHSCLLQNAGLNTTLNCLPLIEVGLTKTQNLSVSLRIVWILFAIKDKTRTKTIFSRFYGSTNLAKEHNLRRIIFIRRKRRRA